MYGFGSNSDSQLGIGDSANQVSSLPQKLQIEPKKWKVIAAGTAHSCALTGKLYFFKGKI